jgi:cell wall-associated NlpC family hydrolase
VAAGGLSGTGVAMATGGAFLIYIGLRNIPVLAGLREISAGRLPAPRPKIGGLLGDLAGSIVGNVGGAAGGAPGPGSPTGPTGGPWPQLVTAAQQFAKDKYSQTRRWDPGYSDCSSFVGKALKSLGVPPPGISVTTSYLAWGQLMKIDRS